MTDPSVPRPKRVQTASAKLLDTSNTAAPSLASHREAIETRRAIEQKQAEDAARQNHETTPRCSTPPRSPSEPVTDPGNQSESDRSEQQPR